MVLMKVGIGQRIRGAPNCRNCGVNIRSLIRQGKTVYLNRAWKPKARYLCAKCKSDLFEGVKLRENGGMKTGLQKSR